MIGAGLAVVAPAEFSLIPVAAGEDRVAAANGRVEAARYLGMTVGPVLGGLLAGAGSFHAAVLLNACSFLAVALAGAALRFAARARRAAAGDRRRARDGLAVLVADRSLRIVLATNVASLALFDADRAAELFFVLDVLHAGQTGYGVLIGVWTAGMVAGAVLLAAASLAAARCPSRSRRSQPREPGCSGCVVRDGAERLASSASRSAALRTASRTSRSAR